MISGSHLTTDPTPQQHGIKICRIREAFSIADSGEEPVYKNLSRCLEGRGRNMKTSGMPVILVCLRTEMRPPADPDVALHQPAGLAARRRAPGGPWRGFPD